MIGSVLSRANKVGSGNLCSSISSSCFKLLSFSSRLSLLHKLSRELFFFRGVNGLAESAFADRPVKVTVVCRVSGTSGSKAALTWPSVAIDCLLFYQMQIKISIGG